MRFPSAPCKSREATPCPAAVFPCRMPWLSSSKKNRQKSHRIWLRRPPCRKCASLLEGPEDNSPRSRPGGGAVARRCLTKYSMPDKAMRDGSSETAPRKARSLLRRRTGCPPVGCEGRFSAPDEHSRLLRFQLKLRSRCRHQEAGPLGTVQGTRHRVQPFRL